MILWAKIPLPATLTGEYPPYSTKTFRCDEAVRDPSLAHEIGRVTGGHVGVDGTLHVQIELDEEKLAARLAERRAAF